MESGPELMFPADQLTEGEKMGTQEMLHQAGLSLRRDGGELMIPDTVEIAHLTRGNLLCLPAATLKIDRVVNLYEDGRTNTGIVLRLAS